MRRYIKTNIFKLLYETSPENIPLRIWEKAYDKFAGALFRERTAASDREGLYNALCYASVELKSLQECGNRDKKKRMNKICF
ncbi:MAG: hypothetical protein LBF62_11830 [Tannerellaceae bacterium]|jgi:hypothetical protein|nr:hypothetical protein [Tannerellaceae bacterium]